MFDQKRTRKPVELDMWKRFWAYRWQPASDRFTGIGSNTALNQLSNIFNLPCGYPWPQLDALRKSSGADACPPGGSGNWEYVQDLRQPHVSFTWNGSLFFICTTHRVLLLVRLISWNHLFSNFLESPSSIAVSSLFGNASLT